METKTPPRMRFKQAMTATAFALITIRGTWRRYFDELQAERQDTKRGRRGSA